MLETGVLLLYYPERMADLRLDKPVGRDDNVFSVDDVTVTETEYYYKVIDWHRHEKPYFSFVTAGWCRESNRRKTYDCNTNSLLFHNAGDAHFNVKSGKISQGIAVELNPRWCKKYEVDLDEFPSSVQVIHPEATLVFYNIYREARFAGPMSGLVIDAFLLEGFAALRGCESSLGSGKPRWVGKIDEILRENNDQPLSLIDISAELGVHWAHLSREFPRYFRLNFSQYARKIKVEKAIGLLRKRSITLADVAAGCGFADQSHFTRCFKKYLGITPLDFRKLVQ